MEFAYPPYAVRKPQPPPPCAPFAPLFLWASVSTKLRLMRTKTDRQSGERYFVHGQSCLLKSAPSIMHKMSISKAHPPPFYPPCWRFIVLGDCVLHTSQPGSWQVSLLFHLPSPKMPHPATQFPKRNETPTPRANFLRALRFCAQQIHPATIIVIYYRER